MIALGQCLSSFTCRVGGNCWFPNHTMLNSCSLRSVGAPQKLHEKGLLLPYAGIPSRWLAPVNHTYLFPTPRPETCHINSLKSVTVRVFPPHELTGAINRNFFSSSQRTCSRTDQHATTYKDLDSARGWQGSSREGSKSCCLSSNIRIHTNVCS